MIKLILTTGEKVTTLFSNEIKNSNKNVIGVLTTKSYGAFKGVLKKVCTSKKNCIFIDTIAETNEENVVYIPSANLTALSIAINQAQQPFKGKTTIVFDSFANILMSNDISIVTKFIIFILTKARTWGADVTLVMSATGANDKLIELIKQSVDKVEKK